MTTRGHLTRRSLLAAAVGAAGALAGIGCEPRRRRRPRRRPAKTRQAAVAKVPDAQVARFELDEVGVAELGRALASGHWTSRGLVDRYIERIEAIDRVGPTLRSFIVVNPEAREIADALDRERRAGRLRGPLHGIPIVVKDNIDTADRMPTTAGSLALEGSIAPRDAAVVAKLRAAGAIILGKANLSEWANLRSTHSTSGWSAVGGLVRNPYALRRNPCGSSSGTAVAVAASLVAAGIGTETDGSIVCPASICGIVGLKPTVGLVSRAGIVPIAHSQDTAGPMGRTVEDIALVLAAIAGVDPNDPATATAPAPPANGYADALQPDGLRGARIGVARKLFGFHPDADRVADAAVTVLRDAGAVLVDPIDLEQPHELDALELTVLLYELKADLGEYLAARGSTVAVHSLEELVAWNERHADRELAIFGQEYFLQAKDKGPLTTPEYVRARARCLEIARTRGVDAAVRKDRLDAIFAPTTTPAYVTDTVNGDHFIGATSTLPAVAGTPAITVPGGFVRGLPVGVSFFGPAFSEATLLRIAYAYEQATKHRRAPTFPEEAAGVLSA